MVVLFNVIDIQRSVNVIDIQRNDVTLEHKIQQEDAVHMMKQSCCTAAVASQTKSVISKAILHPPHFALIYPFSYHSTAASLSARLEVNSSLSTLFSIDANSPSISLFSLTSA